MGLISALRPFCQVTADGSQVAWWLERHEFANSAEDLRRFVDDLERIYTDERLEDFKLRVAGIDSIVIDNFLRELPEIVERHRAASPLPLEALQQAAEKYVRSEFATGPLTCLGVGEEGVVLTDGRLVYKHFHYWKPRGPLRANCFPEVVGGKGLRLPIAAGSSGGPRTGRSRGRGVPL